jgi:hypothetical protein
MRRARQSLAFFRYHRLALVSSDELFGYLIDVMGLTTGVGLTLLPRTSLRSVK